MRTFTKEDVGQNVKVEIHHEFDDTQVRGNALASGDDEADRAYEDAIIRRLLDDDTLAWCGVVCVVTFTSGELTLQGQASIWGCTLDSEAEVATTAEEHGLLEEALEDLNKEVEAWAAHALKMLETLGAVVAKIPVDPEPKYMIRTKTEVTALAFAAERGLLYGLSVLGPQDMPWYVGTREQLERVGVADIKHPLDYHDGETKP